MSDGSLPIQSVALRPVAAFIQGMRVHQWAKNVLIAVPLLLAHRANDISLVLNVVLAFLAMGLAASGTYLFNDVLDVENDRKHPKKRHRPFASGALPTRFGYAAAPLLVLIGIAIAAPLGLKVMGLVGAYAVLSTTYSLIGKSIAPLDVVWLGALYTLRLIVGAAATYVVATPWLLAFSLFLFTGLAFGKRAAELVAMPSDAKAAPGRGYSPKDLTIVSTLGATTSVVSVLVLALYFQSNDVTILWNHPSALRLCIPVVLFFVSRFWITVMRGEMHHDPVVWALKDKASWAAAAISAGALVLGSMPK